MARLVGFDIPDNKHIEISLTYIFGIGRSTAKLICKKANVRLGTRTRDLTEAQTVRIRDIIENEHKVEGALRCEACVHSRSNPMRNPTAPARPTWPRVDKVDRAELSIIILPATSFQACAVHLTTPAARLQWCIRRDFKGWNPGRRFPI